MFPQAEIYASTISHSTGPMTMDDRLNRLSRSKLPLYKRINSTQIFILALLLFVATGVQTYFKHLPSTYESLDLLTTLSLAIDEFLSPLMLLACSVAMAGTLCRGLELVICATAFKAK